MWPRLFESSFRRTLTSLVAACFFLPVPAAASGWQCWQDASDRYGVPINLLYAVSRVESGNKAGALSAPNKNGTYDIGLMQINSSHLPYLSRYGITEGVLMRDPCVNLHIGAWIMAQSIARHGMTWRGIGAYNAASDEKRRIYAKKVLSMLGPQP